MILSTLKNTLIFGGLLVIAVTIPIATRLAVYQRQIYLARAACDPRCHKETFSWDSDRECYLCSPDTCFSNPTVCISSGCSTCDWSCCVTAPTPTVPLGGSCTKDEECQGYGPGACQPGAVFCWGNKCRKYLCDVGECQQRWDTDQEHHACQSGLHITSLLSDSYCCPLDEPDCDAYCVGATPTPTPTPTPSGETCAEFCAQKGGGNYCLPPANAPQACSHWAHGGIWDPDNCYCRPTYGSSTSTSDCDQTCYCYDYSQCDCCSSACKSAGLCPSTPTPTPTPRPTIQNPVLIADPDQGIAPLHNVDLTIKTGLSPGAQAFYNFDCGDSGGKGVYNVGTTPQYTVRDLCNYPSPGIYTARVQARITSFVGAELLSEGEATTTITVLEWPGVGAVGLPSASELDLSGNGTLGIEDWGILVAPDNYGQTGADIKGDCDADEAITILDVSCFVGVYRREYAQ